MNACLSLLLCVPVHHCPYLSARRHRVCLSAIVVVAVCACPPVVVVAVHACPHPRLFPSLSSSLRPCPLSCMRMCRPSSLSSSCVPVPPSSSSSSCVPVHPSSSSSSCVPVHPSSSSSSSSCVPVRPLSSLCVPVHLSSSSSSC